MLLPSRYQLLHFFFFVAFICGTMVVLLKIPRSSHMWDDDRTFENTSKVCAQQCSCCFSLLYAAALAAAFVVCSCPLGTNVHSIKRHNTDQALTVVSGLLLSSRPCAYRCHRCDYYTSTTSEQNTKKPFNCLLCANGLEPGGATCCVVPPGSRSFAHSRQLSGFLVFSSEVVEV